MLLPQQSPCPENISRLAANRKFLAGLQGRLLGAPFFIEYGQAVLFANFLRKNYLAGFACGVLVLLLLVLTVYWPGLSGAFFFDDSFNILQSPAIKVSEFTVDSFLNLWASGIAGPLGRPVSLLTFAANYYYAGFDPYWFKLTNLLIHCLNTVLIGFLSLLCLRAARVMHSDAGWQYGLAGLVAAFWALHPIQLTSVLYVVQRMTSLSSTFVLLGLILHIWGRQRPSFAWSSWLALLGAWTVCLPLAMLSKETGILFVLYAGAYEAILQRSHAGRFDRFGTVFLGLLLLLSVGFSISLLIDPSGGLLGSYAIRSFTLQERVLTESRILWAYVTMIVLPSLSDFGLYHDDYVVSTGIFQPFGTLLAIVGLVASLPAIYLLRNKAPIAAFGLLWFLAGHSLELTVFPLELMHEHRNYLPSLGIIFLFVPALAFTKGKSSIFRYLTIGAFLSLTFYSALLTYLRADMYGNDYRRTQLEAGYRSESVRSQYDAGAVLVNMYNHHRESILASMANKHFQIVNELSPSYKLALVGMLQLDCLSEGGARSDVYEELKVRLAQNKWETGDRTVMHGIAEMLNAGTLCLGRTQVDGLFVAALGNPAASIQDRSVVASDYVRYLWLGQSDFEAARTILKKVVADNESDVLNRINLLQLSRFLGEHEEVVKYLADLQERKLGRRDNDLGSNHNRGISQRRACHGALMVKISVILPARNEAISLVSLLPAINRLLPEAEIIVVNDGSSDLTETVALKAGATVVRHPYSQGNGAAIKTGARKATGDILVFMDADSQHRPEDIPRLLEKLEDGYDMVVGARDGAGQASRHRGLANGFYNRLASWMVGHAVKDLTSGFRAVRREKFLEFLYLLPNGFSYPTTITMAFFRAGYAVTYEPIEVQPRMQGTESHIRLVARWHPLPVDHLQDRNAVLAAKAVRACCIGPCAGWPGYYAFTFFDAWTPVLGNDLLAECFGHHISDWSGFRANYATDVQAVGTRFVMDKKERQKRGERILACLETLRSEWETLPLAAGSTVENGSTNRRERLKIFEAELAVLRLLQAESPFLQQALVSLIGFAGGSVVTLPVSHIFRNS